jgi:hypothetical protein
MLSTEQVEFTSDYSKDADASVIQDSKFKKLEFLKALAIVSLSIFIFIFTCILVSNPGYNPK